MDRGVCSNHTVPHASKNTVHAALRPFETPTFLAAAFRPTPTPLPPLETLVAPERCWRASTCWRALRLSLNSFCLSLLRAALWRFARMRRALWDAVGRRGVTGRWLEMVQGAAESQHLNSARKPTPSSTAFETERTAWGPCWGRAGGPRPAASLPSRAAPLILQSRWAAARRGGRTAGSWRWPGSWRGACGPCRRLWVRVGIQHREGAEAMDELCSADWKNMSLCHQLAAPELGCCFRSFPLHFSPPDPRRPIYSLPLATSVSSAYPLCTISAGPAPRSADNALALLRGRCCWFTVCGEGAALLLLTPLLMVWAAAFG